MGHVPFFVHVGMTDVFFWCHALRAYNCMRGAFFVTMTNVPKNLTLEVLGLGVTAALPLPFVVAVPVAFFLIEIEPGGRPAPGLRPPEPSPWPVKRRRA